MQTVALHPILQRLDLGVLPVDRNKLAAQDASGLILAGLHLRDSDALGQEIHPYPRIFLFCCRKQTHAFTPSVLFD